MLRFSKAYLFAKLLSQNNRYLRSNLQIFELESKLEESCVESQRLQEESNSQLVKITDLQQRILAEETHTKQLTNKCIEKDVEVQLYFLLLIKLV